MSAPHLPGTGSRIRSFADSQHRDLKEQRLMHQFLQRLLEAASIEEAS